MEVEDEYIPEHIDQRQLKIDTKEGMQLVNSKMDAKRLYETPEELKVVKGNGILAKRRAYMGFLAGAITSGLAWQSYVGRRNSVILAAVAGGFAGTIGGALTVRSKLFLDMISLPEDQSPFARDALQILREEMPGSILHAEIRRRRRYYEQFRADAAASKQPRSLSTPSTEVRRPSSLLLHRDDRVGYQDYSDPIPEQGTTAPWVPADGAAHPWGNLPTMTWGSDSDDFKKGKETEPTPTTWEEIRRRGGPPTSNQ